MDLRLLVEAGALGLFAWYSLRLVRQHQKYIESRDLIIAQIFADQSKRDQETRTFLLRRDEDQRNFWLQMRGEYNSTLADNTAVIHKVVEAMNRNNKLFEDLSR